MHHGVSCCLFDDDGRSVGTGESIALEALPLTLMLLLSAAATPSAYATPPPSERLEYLVASSGNYRLNSTCAF